ncbi:MAG: GTP 3',8-cyclase MoaA [Flexilinea sp.]
MKDQFGREINYLRLSVTDKCNLRCIYCSPGDQENCTMLTAEEIVRMVRIMVKLGINKVRITGGEPLIRMDLEQILSGITAINGISDVPMTTNAIGLSARLNGLCDAGLTRLNISLDSLIPEKYQKITGSDSLPEVLRGIDIAVKKGVSVKINSVLIRGINDDEVDSLIDLGKNQPISIRFIEMMPIGKYAVYHQDRVILNKEILADRPGLIRLMDDSGSVAEVYQKPGYQGTVGFISSLSPIGFVPPATGSA